MWQPINKKGYRIMVLIDDNDQPARAIYVAIKKSTLNRFIADILTTLLFYIKIKKIVD